MGKIKDNILLSYKRELDLIWERNVIPVGEDALSFIYRVSIERLSSKFRFLKKIDINNKWISIERLNEENISPQDLKEGLKRFISEISNIFKILWDGILNEEESYLEEIFYLVKSLRSFNKEIYLSKNMKFILDIAEKYIKEIFKIDSLALIMDLRGINIFGYGKENFIPFVMGIYEELFGRRIRKEYTKIFLNGKEISEIKPSRSFSEAYMLFPLIAKKDIGLIGISKEKGSFDKKDLALFSFLSSQIANAIKNLEYISYIKGLAIRDPLTGLYNRRYFDEIFHYEYIRAKRYNFPLSFIMIDIDHFKLINDTFGHLIGDKVLQEVARLIKGSIRQADIGVRFGGEEFAIILPNTSLDKAIEIAERLRRRIEDHEISLNKEKKLSITVSEGVSSLREDTLSEEQIIEEADKALLKAKMAGRNRIYLFTEKGLKEIKSGIIERRKFKRVPVDFKMEYMIISSLNKKNIGRVINMSEEGICFENSSIQIQPDSLLLVDLNLPIEDGEKSHVRAIAQVRWKREDKEKTIVGAIFTPLSSKDRELIKKYFFSKGRSEI